MLKELYVENFGLIEKDIIEFSTGLNVLTGETGAGKSLIIDALGLLVGGRGSQDFIRTGAEKLVLQGTFSMDLPPLLIEFLIASGFNDQEEILTISRELSRSGKNTCRVNFRPVSLSFLRELGKNLINIHGQHEHVNLLEEETQLLLLDSFGGQKLVDLRENIKKIFLEMKAAKNKIEELKIRHKEALKRGDYLNFQIQEILDANILPQEDTILEKERLALQSVEKLASLGKRAYENLYGNMERGAWDVLGETTKLLEEASLLDEKAKGLFQKTNDIYYLIEDVVRELGDYNTNIINDPQRLDEIEQRLYLINGLKKKYGGTIEDILHTLREAQNEIKTLGQEEADFLELSLVMKKATDNYQALSDTLSKLRIKSGTGLSQAVTKELHELHMQDAEFQVEIVETSWGLTGKNQANFLVRTNFGEEMKPVIKIASGGELSRIMLGIKVILSQLDQTPVLIFDEIDSGLGGKSIYEVGKKLKTIAQTCQVICVTHSPVIAGFANGHLRIVKETKEDRTITKIDTLCREQVLTEIGRMLAGENISDVTLSQARELLKLGQETKKKISTEKDK